MPPRWLRRVVLAPAVVALTLVALTTIPVALLVAVAVSPAVPGRWRPLRLLGFAVSYLVIESCGLLACLVLWVASGFGAGLRRPVWQAAHWRVLAWCLHAIVVSARIAFRLRIDVDERDARVGRAATQGAAPLLVLARHAGPGDSFLLVEWLLRRRLRPRIVLRSTLQWEPLLDVILGRLPAQFVGDGTEAVRGIGALAGTMGPGDALVIFPEGGNFTVERRRRSIAKLEELGRHEDAEQARLLRHVLMPRTAGTLAAMDAATGADVLFVAHTGLEDLSTPVDLWRGLPMDAEVHVELWHEPADDLPTTPEERRDWLVRWWRRIDRWILRTRGEHALPDLVVEAVREDEVEAVREDDVEPSGRVDDAERSGGGTADDRGPELGPRPAAPPNGPAARRRPGGGSANLPTGDLDREAP